MEATKEIREIISKDTSLCDHWAGGTCYFPDGFRKHNKNKSYPECRLNGEICKKCIPDSVLYDSRPSYYEKKD